MCSKFLISFTLIIFVIVFTNNVHGYNPVKKSAQDEESTNSDNDETEDKGLAIEANTENTGHKDSTCEKTDGIHEVMDAKPAEFTFMAAIMSKSNEYLCSGVTIAFGMILTTAKCIEKDPGYVILNATTVNDTYGIRSVIEKTKLHPPLNSTDIDEGEMNITKLPETFEDKSITTNDVTSDSEMYDPNSESEDKRKKRNNEITANKNASLYDVDIGIIYFKPNITPTATKLMIDAERNYTHFEIVGFRMKENVSPLRLQYIGVGVQPAKSGKANKDFLMRAKYDCLDNKLSLTCVRDTGNPVIASNKLVGVVTKEQSHCMNFGFDVSSVVAEFVPSDVFKNWVEQQILQHDKKKQYELVFYPKAPEVRKLTSASAGINVSLLLLIATVIMPFV